jgi:hypothetical protein
MQDRPGVPSGCVKCSVSLLMRPRPPNLASSDDIIALYLPGSGVPTWYKALDTHVEAK